MAGNRELLQKKNRIVVKVGSSTLTHETGKLNYHRIERLAMEIADLANQGKEMVLVSSGAVSAGMGPLGLSSRSRPSPPSGRASSCTPMKRCSANTGRTSARYC